MSDMIDTGAWVADALAQADSRTQAAFINRFCSTLVGICHRNEGSQVWHIAEHLDKSAADLLKELADSRAHHEDAYRQDTLHRDDLYREIARLEQRKAALEKNDE